MPGNHYITSSAASPTGPRSDGCGMLQFGTPSRHRNIGGNIQSQAKLLHQLTDSEPYAYSLHHPYLIVIPSYLLISCVADPPLCHLLPHPTGSSRSIEVFFHSFRSVGARDREKKIKLKVVVWKWSPIVSRRRQ